MMRFYLPNKPHKWGFKLHSICDSIPHSYSELIFDPRNKNKNLIDPNSNQNVGYQIVMSLVDKLPYSGHSL